MSRDNDRKRFGGRRLLIAAGSAASLALVATLVLGTSYGLFSSTSPTQSNTIKAGTVTLSQSAVHNCAIGPMAPGEASTGWTPAGSDLECSFIVTYGGNAPAFIGLDVSIAPTHAGSDPNGVLTGANGLYDSTTTGLQVSIKDSNSVVYMSNTTLGGAATTGASPSAGDLLESTTPATNGTSVEFTVDYSLPAGSTNAYMKAASSISLIAHAVQAKNNGNALGCTSGRVCPGITGWS